MANINKSSLEDFQKALDEYALYFHTYEKVSDCDASSKGMLKEMYRANLNCLIELNNILRKL